MYWLKKDLRKNSIDKICIKLLLMFIVWVPVIVMSAQEKAAGSAKSRRVTVQATPSADATVTALNKEKLKQEIQQLKNQNEPNPLGWIRINIAILLSTLTVVVGGFLGLGRWLADRRRERKKRDEERFQATVTRFGEEQEDAKIGAAIGLRTFLRSGYQLFYAQIFDLTVAHLRQKTSLPLNKALTDVFLEASPKAHKWVKQGSPSSHREKIMIWLKRIYQEEEEKQLKPESLNASHIILDKAFLWKADLEQIYMPWASLQETDLSVAKLRGAKIWCANLSGAKLSGADLSNANLGGADLSNAKLYPNKD
jgi:hypothetical protein